MKGKEIELGTRIWEDTGTLGEPYSAGRVVAISDSVDRGNVVYVLLRSDEGKFTIYSMEKNFNCNPRLTREIPSENFEDLVRAGLSGIELPKESLPVPQKVKMKTPAPKDTPDVDVSTPFQDDASAVQPPDVTQVEFIKNEDDTTTVMVDDSEVEFNDIFIGFDVTMSVV